jgi:hypothetical protein
MKNLKTIFILGIAIIINILSLANCYAKVSSNAVENIYVRPNAAAGPTKVEVGIWAIDIDSIDSAMQNFTANVFIILKWHDPRLVHSDVSDHVYNLNDVWSPRIQLANEIGIVRKTMPEIVDVKPDGTVTYRQRYVGPLSQPLKLQDFPFDKHVFTIHFAAISTRPQDIDFVPMAEYLHAGLKDAAGISENISLPDWSVIDYQAKSLPYEIIPGKTATAGYALQFTAARHGLHYLFKVISPLMLIVFMSWLVFLIEAENFGTRIGIATTSMLTLIAYRFAIGLVVPRVQYMTRLDRFTLISTILVFLIVVEVGLTSWLIAKKKPKLAVKLKKFSHYFFPIVFVVMSVWTLLF